MKIGILGSGDVGKTLAAGFIKHGYEVMIGTRDEEKLSDWKAKAGKKAKTGSLSETAAFGDAVVLAVKGTAAMDAIGMAGADNLEDKIVIDTTNPIDNAPPENGVLRFFTSLDESLMEQLQESYPQSKFVKAFNSVGHALMVNPDFDGVRPTMFICGNDDNARRKVAQILDQFGFEVADMGRAEAARAIEPLCILWCIPGFLHNNWGHAFKLLKK
jgi:predicted dinucleotide-binding enzyme